MDAVKIPRQSREIMINQALKELPNECCGLLLGKNKKIKRAIPVKNSEPAPDAYIMDPLQQIDIFAEMEKKDETLLGIYHSHPKGPATPSDADLQMAFHPDLIYIIISLEKINIPKLSAFVLKKGALKEVKLT